MSAVQTFRRLVVQCANPLVLESPIYDGPQRREEFKNDALEVQDRPSRYFDPRTGLVIVWTCCVVHGSGRGARPGAERSCRADAKQAEPEDFAAASRGHTAWGRG